MNLFHELLKTKIIAIFRNIPEPNDSIQALYDGGIRFAEITLNSDNALASLHHARTVFDQKMHIGAGTVLNKKMAEEAIAAGATYIITPNLDIETVQYCLSKQIDIWPGVMTPTEIVAAIQNGATAVKLFPASSLGSGYVKEIKAPLNHIPFIATGGITKENIQAFQQAGCEAFGLGSSLFNREQLQNRDYEAITRNSREFIHLLKESAK